MSTSLFSKALLEVIVSLSSSPPLTGVLKVRPLNTVTVSVSSLPRDQSSICTQRLAYAFDRENYDTARVPNARSLQRFGDFFQLGRVCPQIWPFLCSVLQILHLAKQPSVTSPL